MDVAVQVWQDRAVTPETSLDFSGDARRHLSLIFARHHSVIAAGAAGAGAGCGVYVGDADED